VRSGWNKRKTCKVVCSCVSWLATIQHGLPLTLLPFTEPSEEYLAFWGVSTVPTSPFASHMQPVFRCASPLRSHADKPAISKRQLNLSSILCLPRRPQSEQRVHSQTDN
jgi:hypothetical protein